MAVSRPGLSRRQVPILVAAERSGPNHDETGPSAITQNLSPRRIDYTMPTFREGLLIGVLGVLA